MNKSTHTRNIEAIADLLSECDEAIEHIGDKATRRMLRKRAAPEEEAQAEKEDDDARNT